MTIRILATMAASISLTFCGLVDQQDLKSQKKQTHKHQQNSTNNLTLMDDATPPDSSGEDNNTDPSNAGGTTVSTADQFLQCVDSWIGSSNVTALSIMDLDDDNMITNLDKNVIQSILDGSNVSDLNNLRNRLDNADLSGANAVTCMDLNQDGQVDASDLQMIVSHIDGIISDLSPQISLTQIRDIYAECIGKHPFHFGVSARTLDVDGDNVVLGSDKGKIEHILSVTDYDLIAGYRDQTIPGFFPPGGQPYSCLDFNEDDEVNAEDRDLLAAFYEELLQPLAANQKLGHAVMSRNITYITGTNATGFTNQARFENLNAADIEHIQMFNYNPGFPNYGIPANLETYKDCRTSYHQDGDDVVVDLHCAESLSGRLSIIYKSATMGQLTTHTFTAPWNTSTPYVKLFTEQLLTLSKVVAIQVGTVVQKSIHGVMTDSYVNLLDNESCWSKINVSSSYLLTFSCPVDAPINLPAGQEVQFTIVLDQSAEDGTEQLISHDRANGLRVVGHPAIEGYSTLRVVPGGSSADIGLFQGRYVSDGVYTIVTRTGCEEFMGISANEYVYHSKCDADTSTYDMNANRNSVSRVSFMRHK